MKSLISSILVLLVITACQKKTKYPADKYFDEAQQKELLINLVTYIDIPAPGSNNRNKFDIQYRKYYERRAGLYKLQSYYVADDSTHYYFIVRPAGNNPLYKRGVGGKLKLRDNSLTPKEFEELYNTPRLPEKDVIEKGGYIFSEMIKSGQVDQLVNMKHYIEWPDSTLKYDKKTHEWVPLIKI